MKTPDIAPGVFVAPGATVLGDVTLSPGSSVFFGAVLRAEEAAITVGARTNIQDNCVLHVDAGHPLTLGEDCTVGHSAILHSCTVGDNTLVGMGAIVLNDAVIGSNCVIAAGALVTQSAVIPDGSLVMGSPGKVKRLLTEEEITANRESAVHYEKESREYAAYFCK